MQQRINIEQTSPQAYKALYQLSMVISHHKLTPIQKQLIKIRASQINGCAFCINMHTQEALQVGETSQRIFLLNACKETDLFTPEEKTLLAMVEEVTLIHQHAVSDATYAQAKEYFDDEAISEILMSTVVINAWNRIAITSQLPVQVA
jgi:alkylhydroperoxidase AhpD family core domain